MDDLSLVLGGVSVFLTVMYLVINGQPWNYLVTRVKGRGNGQKTSSQTSYMSSPLLPPEKQPSSAKHSAFDSLPPLRRDWIAKVHGKGTESEGKGPLVDEEYIKKALLPMTADYETTPGSVYTPTGFSVDEIKALGTFPDYAKLSGIPLPDAYVGFDIDKALARPYRPFRWSYHQTMSLTKMEPNWWLELENTYKQRISERKELYLTHGKEVLDYLPGSELACRELLEMVVQFLCARYPMYFSLSEDKRFFRNEILGVTEDLGLACQQGKGDGKHPLEILMDHVPEDFAVMMRDEKSGNYFFRAGMICSSLGWNVGTKIGLQLHEIHGPIPDYKEKMQFSMDRYFSKMPTDKPIQRGSWGLETATPLYMPPNHPHAQLRLSQSPTLTLPSCFLRVDWQTLRRLPLSGAIIFNFKALFTPVTEFRDEPCIPALVSRVLRNGKTEIMEYKGTWHVEHVVLPALQEWAAEQVEKGMVKGDWEVATLDESPFFKGWEEKWRWQQGF